MRRLISPPALLSTASVALLVAAGGCSGEDSPSAAQLEAVALLSVTPQGGAIGVSPDTEVVLDFDHPLMPGMQAYVDLHEGALTGPAVPGVWALSPDGRRLTFAPAERLKLHTEYTVHIGGGMLGREGQPVECEEGGLGMGGTRATSGMIGGGGGMGGGGGDHMGEGWQHPSNGSFGMVFPFATGG